MSEISMCFNILLTGSYRISDDIVSFFNLKQLSPFSINDVDISTTFRGTAFLVFGLLLLFLFIRERKKRPAKQAFLFSISLAFIAGTAMFAVAGEVVWWKSFFSSLEVLSAKTIDQKALMIDGPVSAYSKAIRAFAPDEYSLFSDYPDSFAKLNKIQYYLLPIKRVAESEKAVVILSGRGNSIRVDPFGKILYAHGQKYVIKEICMASKNGAFWLLILDSSIPVK